MEITKTEVTREHSRDGLETIDDGGTLLGTVYVFGTPYHFMFIEVVEKDGEWVAVSDPYDRLNDFQRVDSEARYLTTEIDGKQYIGCATPYGD